jgi:hypothetical protein
MDLNANPCLANGLTGRVKEFPTAGTRPPAPQPSTRRALAGGGCSTTPVRFGKWFVVRLFGGLHGEFRYAPGVTPRPPTEAQWTPRSHNTTPGVILAWTTQARVRALPLAEHVVCGPRLGLSNGGASRSPPGAARASRGTTLPAPPSTPTWSRASSMAGSLRVAAKPTPELQYVRARRHKR